MSWPTSEVELLSAYRQAKASLFFERRGTGRLVLASFEEALPDELERIARELAVSPLFDGLDVGEVRVVPKSAKHASPRTARIIQHPPVASDHRIETLDVRIQVEPNPAFAIREVLWLRRFGHWFEELIPKTSFGYRLKISRESGRVSTKGRHLFDHWPTAYTKYRDETLKAAQAVIDADGGAYLACLDFAGFYDRIDPAFLISDRFVEELLSVGMPESDRDLYLEATTSLVTAFARFRTSIGRYFDEAEPRLGIPIGALSSRLVANLVLRELDRVARASPSVRHYARYVDDILIVLGHDAVASTDGVKELIAAAFAPVSVRSDNDGKLSLVDLGGTATSELVFQSQKVRAHALHADDGREFLKRVMGEFSRVASERRVLLDPDMGEEPEPDVLVAAHDQAVELSMLRDADALKLQKAVTSSTLSKLLDTVLLIAQDDASELATKVLRTHINAMTVPGAWLAFLDQAVRAVSIGLVAGVEDAVILAHRELRFRVDEMANDRRIQVYWNGIGLPRSKAIAGVRAWVEMRLQEAVAAGMKVIPVGKPVTAAQPASLRSGFDLGGESMSAVTLNRHARRLRCADLRALPFEDDVPRLAPPLHWPKAHSDRLYRWTRKSETLTNVVHAANQFLVAKQGPPLGAGTEDFDAPINALRAIEVLLSPRPPSVFQISYAWTTAGGDAADLPPVVTAIRGRTWGMNVSYFDGDTTVIDPESRLFIDENDLHEPRIVLANLPLTKEDVRASITATPNRSWKRMRELLRIVKRAMWEQQTSRRPVLLLIPEWGLPDPWLELVSSHLIEHARRFGTKFGTVSMVAGLEYSPTPAKTVQNRAIIVMPFGFHTVFLKQWIKQRPARREGEFLKREKFSFPHVPAVPEEREVLSTPYGKLAVLICSEVLQVKARANLAGRIDLLLVPSFNTDTTTWDNVLSSAALELHAFVACANTAKYSDCRVRGPGKPSWRQDVGRLIARDECEVLAVDLPLRDLRKFQALAEAAGDGEPSIEEPRCSKCPKTKRCEECEKTWKRDRAFLASWKPLPPGFRRR